MHDDLHDGRRQARHLVDPCQQLQVEFSHELAKRPIPDGLPRGIQTGNFLGEQFGDMRKAVLGGSHGLHYAPGIDRMVVAVIGDEVTVFGVGGEESHTGISLDFFKMEAAVRALGGPVRLEELSLGILLKGPGMLLLVSNVGGGSRGHHETTAGERKVAPGGRVLGAALVQDMKSHRLNGTVPAGNGFHGIQTLGKGDPLLETFDDFLVIEPVGR